MSWTHPALSPTLSELADIPPKALMPLPLESTSIVDVSDTSKVSRCVGDHLSLSPTPLGVSAYTPGTVGKYFRKCRRHTRGCHPRVSNIFADIVGTLDDTLDSIGNTPVRFADTFENVSDTPKTCHQHFLHIR